jgi:ABC-type bacteriocin/lantibiotic exporter with double-glycine peptidase domain
MVLGYHGHEVGLERVREIMANGRDGVSALHILNAARWFGLRGRGLRVELSDLEYLEPGTILHWELSHFVVLEKATPRGVWIVDPAVGRRRMALPDVSRSFTGVALELEPSGDFTRASRGAGRLWRFIAPVLGRTSLWRRIALTSTLAQALTVALPIFTSALVDQVIPRGDYQLLWVLGGGFLALSIFGYVTQLVRGHLLLQLRTELDVQMSLDLADHMLRLPFGFFQTRQAGDLMTRLNSTTSIREILTSGAASAILDGTLVLGYLVVLLFIHPLMGLLVLLLSALRLAVYFATREPNARLMAESLQAQAASSSYQVQMIQGIETLKSSGAEARSVEQWSQLFAKLMNISIQRGEISVITDAVLRALSVISPVLVLGYGAYLVLSQQLSLGTMLGISALSAGVLGPLTSLTSTALQLQQLTSYVDRVEDILQTPPEQTLEGPRKAPLLHGGVRMEGVTFRYSATAEPAVRRVSLEIHPGQLIAIVGPSGSGKSTLARLMIGLYLAEEGAILLDGVPLQECDLTTVRRQLGFVPQAPHFFDASIRDNIGLTDPSASLEDIQRAAELACIHEEIEAMPLRYDTMLVTSGGTVSGGQRQRIALARSLLTRPALLILDEATSNLDGTTEKRVYENLAALDCSRIVIAHRLSTITRAESILVMERGSIVEQGTHRELLELRGRYARLVSDQARA